MRRHKLIEKNGTGVYYEVHPTGMNIVLLFDKDGDANTLQKEKDNDRPHSDCDGTDCDIDHSTGSIASGLPQDRDDSDKPRKDTHGEGGRVDEANLRSPGQRASMRKRAVRSRKKG